MTEMNTEKILNYLRRRTAGDEEVAAADVIERQAYEQGYKAGAANYRQALIALVLCLIPIAMTYLGWY